MTLYEIDRQLADCFDAETGEIFDEEKLEQLELEWEQKIENIALFYKNLIAEAAAYKTEKEAFAQRQKQAEKKAEQLKKYLEKILEGRKFKTNKVFISSQKSTSVDVFDIDSLDDDYLKYSPPLPDKIKIKESLSRGIPLNGVRLVEQKNIQIK